MKDDVIRELYSKGKSLAHIGNVVGLSAVGVRDRLKKMNVKLKTKQDKWDELHSKFVEQMQQIELQYAPVKLNTKQLANLMNCSKNTLIKHRKRSNIQLDQKHLLE